MTKFPTLFLFIAISPSLAFGGTAIVNAPGDGFLALRSEPTTQNGIRIAKIPHGTQLTLGDCVSSSAKDPWCKTTYHGQSGWVLGRFLVSERQERIAAPGGASSGWRIDLGGFGPVRIGMTVAEASKLVGKKLSNDSSGNENCFFSQLRLPSGTVYFRVKNHRIAEVGSDNPSNIRTTAGIKPGDTLDKVDRAYRAQPGLQRQEDKGIEGDYPAVAYWDSKANNGIIFEYDNLNQVTKIGAGTRSIFYRHEGCD